MCECDGVERLHVYPITTKLIQSVLVGAVYIHGSRSEIVWPGLV